MEMQCKGLRGHGEERSITLRETVAAEGTNATRKHPQKRNLCFYRPIDRIFLMDPLPAKFATKAEALDPVVRGVKVEAGGGRYRPTSCRVAAIGWGSRPRRFDLQVAPRWTSR